MQLSEKRVIVTGGAGFIGSHLVDVLLVLGNTVRIIDDFSIGTMENLQDAKKKKGCEIVKADICDQRKMLKLTRDAEIIYHLAIQDLRSSLNDPWSSHHVNATGTLSMLDAAKQNGVKKFLYVSSSEVYGTAKHIPMTEEHPREPMTVYGASKLAGELYTLAYYRTYKLPVTVICPFNTYGPREPYEGKRAEVIPRFFLQMLHDAPITIFGDGRQTRDFTFVEDTVRGMLAAAESDQLLGQVVNIARGEEVSILEIASKLARILGKVLKVQHLPERPGDVHRHLASIEKANRLLNYKPHVGIDEGLQQYVEWCRKSHIDWDKAYAALTPTNW